MIVKTEVPAADVTWSPNGRRYLTIRGTFIVPRTLLFRALAALSVQKAVEGAENDIRRKTARQSEEKTR